MGFEFWDLGFVVMIVRMIGPLITGLMTTFRHMFKPKVAVNYPYEKVPMFPKYRGKQVLMRDENGLEKCVACGLCSVACPADAIYVEGADNTETDRVSAGERYAKTYQINYLRCIMCGLCVEACPTRALTLTSNFELAFESREEAIYEKWQLLEPPLPLGSAPGTEQGK